jgi:F0F1-type ATP synthase assembly protein I
MRDETINQSVGRAVSEGWGRSGAFAASIISGTLLGLLADSWLGTEPWLVVIGALVGSYSGFMNMWRWSKETEEADRER